MSGTNVQEFGFDEAKIVKVSGYEVFKLNRPGETARISVISFKRQHEAVLARKAGELNRALTDAEKAEFIQKIDTKIAENLGKPADQLTEVDRLDIRKPRFAMSYTHFQEGGVGTIRCMSTYDSGVMVKPDVCCDKLGEADQKIGCVIVSYPIDDLAQVDSTLLEMKKMVNFYVWVMSAKKFKLFERAYADARSDNKSEGKPPVIDLRVTLDGDPKFQKMQISHAGTAFWARQECSPDIRNWILDQGLRAFKHVSSNLGFEMPRDQLLKKLSEGGGGNVSSAAQAEAPKLIKSYDDLIV